MWLQHGRCCARAVHGSGGSVLDPTRTRTAVRRVGGGGTRNRPPASLNRVGFGFGWCSGRFGLLRESPDPTNVAGIFKKFAGICKNRVDLHQKSPKSAWISSNLAGSHQIWSRSRLDLLECRRISPNFAWISSNVAGSHQISFGSPCILPDLYIMLVGSGGSGFGEENPPLDLPASGLGRRNPSPTVGVVGSGGCRFGFRRVIRVGRVPGWVGHPYLCIKSES